MMAMNKFTFLGWNFLFFATITSSTCYAFMGTVNICTATSIRSRTRSTDMNLASSSSPTFLFLSKDDYVDTNHHASISSTSKTATSNRMQFIANSLTRATSLTLLLLLPWSSPQSAMASYGDSTKIELPNYIEYLIEKNSSVDSSKILYKGADMDIQLKRITDASLRLKDIPSIAREKKWSQIQGILTGPLGTLVQTMNVLTKGLSSNDEAVKVAGKVKADLIRISQEATKKDEMGVIKACQQAQDDLETFARLVF